MTPARQQFDRDCEGLIDAIEIAATPDPYGSTVWDGYRAYYGDVVGRAVWQAKYCVRQARKLGLYREPLDLDVLVQLDVQAGDPVEAGEESLR